MLGWIADRAYDSRGRFGDHSQQIATMTGSISKFCWLMDVHKHWRLEEDVANELYDLGHCFLQVSRDSPFRFQ
jgi:hypothetical protein